MGEQPKGNQFPNIEKNLPKSVRYNSLWATKDATRVCEIKVFWIFIEVKIQTWIDHRPWLSLTVYNILQSTAEFKVDMHNLYIRV